MKQFVVFAVLTIVGIGAQPLLFIRGGPGDEERTEVQITDMKLETAYEPKAAQKATRNTAINGELLIELVSKTVASGVQNVPCGGGRSCPDTYPICCTDQRSCCSTSFPVCCNDGLHCCPAQTTCDVSAGGCRRSYIQLNWLVKESTSPAKTAASVRQLADVQATDTAQENQPGSSVGNVPCGGGYACPDGHTCCKSGKEWKCCPSPQAVCCADGKHCCPHGKSCDPSTRSCKPRNVWMDLLKQEPAKEEVKSQNRDGGFVDAPSVNLKVVPCGSGGRYGCQDGQTCCPQPSTGGYGCCVPNYPVCCPDGLHCCQQGTTCDPTSRYCNKGKQIFEAFQKIPARRVAP